MYKTICRQLIAVTNRRLCTRPFAEQMKRVCALQPKALILREKDLSEKDYQRLAQEVLPICQAYQVPCILHSYPGTAMTLGVTAIHLPLPLLEQSAGELAGFQTIGASVHSAAEAQRAQALGASYLTAGHIYATDCKKGLPPRGLSFLREVCSAVTLPVYAIGGININADQLEEILSCGAAGGCAMSEMMRI